MSEALKLAKKVESQGLDTEVAMRLARLVIERETPVRPIIDEYCDTVCPSCSALFARGFHGFRRCHDCGKPLDWGATA